MFLSSWQRIETAEAVVAESNVLGLPVTRNGQPPLWPGDAVAEDPDFLSRQLITCIGSKRSLLGLIGQAVERVKARLGKDRLRVLDAFSGSGVVARFLKAHAALVVSNDLE